MKNRLTLLTGAALLVMASLQAQASLVPAPSTSQDNSGWDLSGIFDSALESIGISAPRRGVATTPVASPTPDLAPYEERFKTQQTATGGVPVCNSRTAASQQSAAQYQVQPVSRAY